MDPVADLGIISDEQTWGHNAQCHTAQRCIILTVDLTSSIRNRGERKELRGQESPVSGKVGSYPTLLWALQEVGIIAREELL